MAVFVLPDAQEDLLWLQAYMLDKWSEDEWAKAENEIFDKLALVDSGLLSVACVKELASIGIFEYKNVLTSHHQLVCRRIDADVYLYAIASHRQNYPTLLMRRLLKR